jgi:hypothetical protein
VSSLIINFEDFQFREGPKSGDPLKPREPELLLDGVLQIGSASGAPYRFLPEGYTPPAASLAALLQLSDDLQALRDIAATEEDLAAEVADLQATIDAIVASGATDSELSAELAPISAAIALLVSSDATTATAIAAIQASIAGLDSQYATDAQLAQAVSALQSQITALTPIVVASASAPAFATGTQWKELNPDGTDKFPWIWAAFNMGTPQAPAWEWRGESVTANGSVSATNASVQLRAPTPWKPRSGVSYRVLDLKSHWSSPAAAGTFGSWAPRIAFDYGSSQPWFGFLSWSVAANTAQAFTTTGHAMALANALMPSVCGGLIWQLFTGSNSTKTVTGQLSVDFVAVRA